MNMVEHPKLTDEAGARRLIGGEDTPIHRSTLWRGIRQKRYPAPIKVGPGTNRWLVDELLALHNRAVAARETEAA